MHPPAVPMVLFGLIAREQFVDHLRAETNRVLYGTGMEEPQGIIGCHPFNHRESEANAS